MPNEGKKFESDIKQSIPQNMFFLRLNDPSVSFGQSSSTRFSPTNICDFIAYKNGIMYCWELKTTLGSLTYWSEKLDDKNKKQSFAIKANQIKGLQYASQFGGIVAGFILNFRKVNKTYFLSIQKFDEMVSKLDKKSFNIDDCISAGAILIEQQIKRTHYKYDIEKLINDM
jgi:recombination protein U